MSELGKVDTCWNVPGKSALERKKSPTLAASATIFGEAWALDEALFGGRPRFRGEENLSPPRSSDKAAATSALRFFSDRSFVAATGGCVGRRGGSPASRFDARMANRSDPIVAPPLSRPVPLPPSQI